jgi:DNA replication protein DnaC
MVVLDGFGMRRMAAVAEDLCVLIRGRCERRSILLTSNQAPGEWPEVFGNDLAASAAIESLTHQAYATCIAAQSHRQRQRPRETPDLTPRSDGHRHRKRHQVVCTQPKTTGYTARL